MGRNWMDASHPHCPENNNQTYSFRILIGNALICPKCGQRIEPIKSFEGNNNLKKEFNSLPSKEMVK